MNTSTRSTRYFCSWALSGMMVACVALAAFAIPGESVAAKPDCAVDDSHPSCEDDDGGDGGSGALEAYTLNSTFCATEPADAEWFADTRDNECPFCPPPPGCQNPNTGSGVPGNPKKAIFTEFQRCMAELTVPGLGSEITFVKSSFSSTRDKQTGDIFAVQLFFEDDNGAKYDSDLIPAYGVPDTQGYALDIYQTVEIFNQGKGRHENPVGLVCVDEVIYEPLP